MIRHFWNNTYPIQLIKSVPRNTVNAQNFFTTPYPYRLNPTEIITTIYPDEFPIAEFKSTKDFTNWFELQFPEIDDGIYYFQTRNLCAFPKTFRKKNWWDKTGHRRRKRYKKRLINVINVIAKIEIMSGQVIHVFEKKAQRNYCPLFRPTFELLKQIKKNNGQVIEEELIE